MMIHRLKPLLELEEKILREDLKVTSKLDVASYVSRILADQYPGHYLPLIFAKDTLDRKHKVYLPPTNSRKKMRFYEQLRKMYPNTNIFLVAVKEPKEGTEIYRQVGF